MKKLTMAQQRFYERVIVGQAKTDNSLFMRAFVYAAVTTVMIVYISFFS